MRWQLVSFDTLFSKNEFQKAETMNAPQQESSAPETEPDKDNPQTEDQPVNTDDAAPGSVGLPALSPELAARSEANRQRALAKLDKEAKRAARKAADLNNTLVAQERASALEQ